MRLFVGIPVPEDFANRLHTIAGRVLPEARLVPTENMHVTLVFLGEVAEAQVSAIEDELSGVARDPLQLRVEGLGSFPGSAIAKIVPNADLSALRAELQKRMARCEFAPEKRAYLPHITLARSRRRTLKLPADALPPMEFVVESFVLYRSWLDPRGARYERMRLFALKAGFSDSELKSRA